MNFEFKEGSLVNINIDDDLFYDLTLGGYIKPYDILKDQELAQKIVEAGKLLSDFFEAIEYAQMELDEI